MIIKSYQYYDTVSLVVGDNELSATGYSNEDAWKNLIKKARWILVFHIPLLLTLLFILLSTIRPELAPFAYFAELVRFVAGLTTIILFMSACLNSEYCTGRETGAMIGLILCLILLIGTFIKNPLGKHCVVGIIIIGTIAILAVTAWSIHRLHVAIVTLRE